jgi:hypothetical protein
MALVLNGSDGSVSTPAMQGSTAGVSTGMYFPATNQVALATNGTLALIVDASQNVGIGTASPSYKLEVQGSANTYFGQRIYNTNAGSSAVAYLQIGNDTNGATAQLGLNSSANTTNFGGANGLYLANGLSAPIAFATAGLERMRILSTGNILSLSGGSTSATGTGITFPATQSASSDANTLDDYEEGTFTPSFSTDGTAPVISTSNAYGSYTKIGRIVNFIIHLTGTTVTSVGTGNMVIAGLPFSVVGDYATFSVGFVAGFTTNQPDMALGRPSLSNMWVYYRTTANGNTTNSTAAEAKTGMEIYISGQYQTNT